MVALTSSKAKLQLSNRLFVYHSTIGLAKLGVTMFSDFK